MDHNYFILLSTDIHDLTYKTSIHVCTLCVPVYIINDVSQFIMCDQNSSSSAIIASIHTVKK